MSAPLTAREIDQAFRNAGTACFVIAVLPAFFGMVLLFLVDDVPLVGRVAPFGWTVVLASIGFGLRRRSRVAIWAGIVVAVGAMAALFAYSFVNDKLDKAGLFIPTVLAVVAVPRLFRLRRVLQARPSGPTAR